MKKKNMKREQEKSTEKILLYPLPYKKDKEKQFT